MSYSQWREMPEFNFLFVSWSVCALHNVPAPESPITIFLWVSSTNHPYTRPPVVVAAFHRGVLDRIRIGSS